MSSPKGLNEVHSHKGTWADTMTGPRKLKNGQWQFLIKLNIRGDSSSPSKNQTWQHSIKSTWASITPKLTWTATYPRERPNINRIMAKENANRQTQEETLLEHLPLAFALERGARNTQKKTKNERNTYIHLAIHPAVPTQTRPLKKGYRKYLQCARCCPPMCKSSIRSRQLQRLKMVRFRGTRYETMDPGEADGRPCVLRRISFQFTSLPSLRYYSRRSSTANITAKGSQQV